MHASLALRRIRTGQYYNVPTNNIRDMGAVTQSLCDQIAILSRWPRRNLRPDRFRSKRQVSLLLLFSATYWRLAPSFKRNQVITPYSSLHLLWNFHDAERRGAGIPKIIIQTCMRAVCAHPVRSRKLHFAFSCAVPIFQVHEDLCSHGQITLQLAHCLHFTPIRFFTGSRPWNAAIPKVPVLVSWSKCIRNGAD